MNKIGNLFSKHIRNIHFTAVIILILVLLFAGTSIKSYINQVISVVFYSPFSIVKNSYLELRKVNEDNERLSQALINATIKISVYEEAERENQRLRSILGFEPKPIYSLLPAEIVSISGSYIPISAIINKGTNDSIAVNMPVINEQGLIGRIASVSPDAAVVQLLTDPSNRVAARITDSREMGIVKYNSRSGMSLENLPIQATISVGDEIISSGLGGIYPSGLKVGIVNQVVKEELEPFYTVHLDPAVNFYSLEEIFILRESIPE